MLCFLIFLDDSVIQMTTFWPGGGNSMEKQLQDFVLHGTVPGQPAERAASSRNSWIYTNRN